MFFYVGRQYHSTTGAVRLVEVTCDRCGCEYHYELTRFGTGIAEAPYGIGSKRASRASEARAQRDLDRMLAMDAELVPCPKCNWISESLVEGCRLCGFRSPLKGEALFATIGLFFTGLISWFLWRGNPGDQAGLPFVLGIGLTISLGLPAIYHICHGMARRSFDPNRDFPVPPALPTGTPKALLLDPVTGLLEPVEPAKRLAFDGQADAEAEHWFDFQIRSMTLPPICCECLGASSSGDAIPVHETLAILIPLCRRCRRRGLWRSCLGAIIALTGASAVGFPILIVLKLDEVVFWFLAGLLVCVAPVVGAMLAGSRHAPYDHRINLTRGVARLWFRNAGYVQILTSEG